MPGIIQLFSYAYHLNLSPLLKEFILFRDEKIDFGSESLSNLLKTTQLVRDSKSKSDTQFPSFSTTSYCHYLLFEMNEIEVR